MQKHLHSLAMLIVMVAVAVSLLGVLALATADSDLRVANRQAEYVSGLQQCANEAQEWLGELGKEGLVQGAVGEAGGEIREKLFTDGEGHFLKVKLAIDGNAYEIKEWISYTKWDQRAINLYNPDETEVNGEH